MERIQTKLSQASLYIFYALLAYMPLHIFLSTWLGTSFHILDIAKTLKDVVLILGVILAFTACLIGPGLRRLIRGKITWLILAYSLLTLVLAAVRPTGQQAEILGVVYNLRFLVFFIYAGLLTQLYPAKLIQKRAITIVLSVGLIVVLFGVLQYLVLPEYLLRHFGYSRAHGVLPAFFIDDQPGFLRIMSTLRDPNSFGSYLLILGPLLSVTLMKTKDKNIRNIMIGGLLLTFLCLVFTFSRSAWLGAVLAAGVLLIGRIGRPDAIKDFIKRTKKYTIPAAIILVVLAGGLFSARNSYVFQNIFVHASKKTKQADPNQLRVKFWQKNIDASFAQPLGHGPGTAGLTSIKNHRQGVNLTENYYLQILYETGFLGLLLFMSILLVVLLGLIKTYRLERNLLALALIAGFIGLSFTNLLVLIWSNEAVAYTWWGLAGLWFFVPFSPDKKLTKKTS